MNPPKHLWSGDWERHSDQPPVAPVQVAPAPPPEEPGPEPGDPGRSRRARLTAIGALVAALIIVGVVLAITLPGSSNPAQPTTAFIPRPFGGNSSGGAPLQRNTTPQPQATTPQQQSTPTVTPAPTATPAPVQIGPTYNWLGMQVSATPAGVAVATVTIGGAADSAGVNPGDVITQVNQTEIGSIAELQAAVKNLKLGSQFQLTVDRGSTPVTLSPTLSNRPKRQS